MTLPAMVPGGLNWVRTDRCWSLDCWGKVFPAEGPAVDPDDPLGLCPACRAKLDDPVEM